MPIALVTMPPTSVRGKNTFLLDLAIRDRARRDFLKDIAKRSDGAVCIGSSEQVLRLAHPELPSRGIFLFVKNACAYNIPCQDSRSSPVQTAAIRTWISPSSIRL